LPNNAPQFEFSAGGGNPRNVREFRFCWNNVLTVSNLFQRVDVRGI
jgi:hypothetical protein